VGDGRWRCATCGADGRNGYQGIDKHGYVREQRSQRAAKDRGEDPGTLLPGVHRIAALVKRRLPGTNQGAIGTAHLQPYLDEFVFRLNRRTSASRGLLFYRLLELAVGHDPVRYCQLVAEPRPKKTPPQPPGSTGHLPSLERPAAQRPWRSTTNQVRSTEQP